MSQVEREEDTSKEFSGPAHLSDLDRRDFFKYMGLFSSMTLLSSCTRPAQHILPMPKEFSEYSQREYEYYTTAISHRGFAQGVRVKCFQGRPIKVEGNKFHPFSLGSTTSGTQATLYDLYHPGRSQKILWKNKKITFSDLKQKIPEFGKELKSGKGVAFVYPPLHSPLLLQQIEKLKKRYPEASWTSFAPWKETSWASYDLKMPDITVTFDEDIFSQRPDALKLSQDFMGKRQEAIRKNTKSSLNRLIVYESSPTLAGAKADQKTILSTQELWNDAIDLKLLLEGKEIQNARMSKLIEGIKGRKTVVILGRHLDPEAKLLEHDINNLLKVSFDHLEFPLPDTHSQDELSTLLTQKKISTLIFLDTDPLYQWPEFGELTKSIPLKVSLSLYPTETHEASQIQIPRSHEFESWGDVETLNGDITIQQPLISPIYDSLSVVEFLKLLDQDDVGVLDELKNKYSANWADALQTGVIKHSAKPSLRVTSGKTYAWKPLSAKIKMKVMPDSSIGFGEFTNNPIMQELPKHFSKVTWQNMFSLSPELAKEKGLQNGDVIKVKNKTAEIKGPVWIQTGIAPQTLVATLGYGMKSGTFVGKKRGFNAYHFQQHEEVEVTKTSKRVRLATTQAFQKIEEKHAPIKMDSLPLKPKVHAVRPASLYPETPLPQQQEGSQWGMTIDLTTCIGCQACVSACQVENNIPFVGEEQVLKDRILHWIRIDTYQINERTFFQPVPCMHCEKAPCEVVCPVNATVHGKGGLNEMLYQRCVGTRYCSNNCPYKVRRFNFRAYSSVERPWGMGLNPEVSVRERGVMEKCSYCIQRIKVGEHTGEAPKTACQEVCPTKAISFGDLTDKNSEVSVNKTSPLNYDLLEEEGVLPRTSYLKVVRYEN